MFVPSSTTIEWGIIDARGELGFSRHIAKTQWRRSSAINTASDWIIWMLSNTRNTFHCTRCNHMFVYWLFQITFHKKFSEKKMYSSIIYFYLLFPIGCSIKYAVFFMPRECICVSTTLPHSCCSFLTVWVRLNELPGGRGGAIMRAALAWHAGP